MDAKAPHLWIILQLLSSHPGDSGFAGHLRQRETLVGAAAQEIQHMQKALTEMNLQLANVISDISGETGLRIIAAVLGGERAAGVLAKLKGPRIMASLVTLERSLEGHWKEEELFRLEQARLSYAHFQEQRSEER